MPGKSIVRSTPIVRTPRVMQLEGLFDVAPAERSSIEWNVSLPIDQRPWNIGLIVGPSGCGKSTVARELFGDHLVSGYEWPADRAIVDAFPEDLGIKDITGLLSSVGFSSPPSWLRPFQVLSNGEQFRVTMARALAEGTSPVVIDEFTSVVDRTVAKVGSAAIAKTIRRRKQQFIAVACHYDIVDWLEPDWTYEPANNLFQWRSLRRPQIEVEVRRVRPSAWKLFKHHHYLDGNLHRCAKCFAGFVEGRPAAFVAVLFFPHAIRPSWREHRAVCLPDYQGVGIGNAMSEFVAGLYLATGRPYRSTTSSPAMIRHRAKSADWKMVRAPSRAGVHHGMGTMSSSFGRVTAGFEYVGRARVDEARGFGLV